MQTTEINKKWYTNKDVVKYVGVLEEKNNVLETLINRLLAEITTLKQSGEETKEMLYNITDLVLDGNNTAKDMRETNYIGKKPEVLEGIMGEVKGITDKSYRSLMYSATNNQPEVYIEVYNKLTAIFKYNVKDIGKKKILTKDNRGYTKPQKSYLNTIILDGKKEEAAAIALDIIRNK